MPSISSILPFSLVAYLIFRQKFLPLQAQEHASWVQSTTKTCGKLLVCAKSRADTAPTMTALVQRLEKVHADVPYSFLELASATQMPFLCQKGAHL